MPYTIRPNEIDLDYDKPVNTGVFTTILENLNELDGLHNNKQTFNEEILKLILDRLIVKFGIKVLFHSWVSNVNASDGKVNSITVNNKSGNFEYSAAYFIDATGDADLSALAGCDFKEGRDKDNLCQSMTLCFRLCDVDWKEYSKYSTNIYDRKMINKLYNEHKEAGLITNPRFTVLFFEHMSSGILHFNSTSVIKKYGTNAEDLTAAEIEGREQAFALFKFMKENIPGFKNSQMLMSGPQIGVRETRRITGEYELTVDDLRKAIKFYDSVARGTYPLDIHSPTGERQKFDKGIVYDDYYTIPYRSLIPINTENLLVVGRSVSSTHEANSAIRIMPICTSIGEGAGIAASIAFKNRIPVNKVDIAELHRLMDSNNAAY